MLHPSPLNPFGSELGFTAVNAKFVRLFTAMFAETGDPPAVAATVPLATITPDHVVLVGLEVRVTVLPLASVNFQLDIVSPELPDSVHVTELPLVVEAGQPSDATFVGPLSGS
jgi:hypothetical protein